MHGAGVSPDSGTLTRANHTSTGPRASPIYPGESQGEPAVSHPVDDLLDPEKLAEHTRLRQRAMGLTVATGFGVAFCLFWAIAYLTELELEMPALASVVAGVAIAGIVWWRLAPKKLSVTFERAEEPDDEALEALSRSFVAPSEDEQAPMSTGAVSDREIAEAARAERSKQTAAVLRFGVPLGVGGVAFWAVFYTLGIRLGADLDATMPAAIVGGLVGFVVHRLMRGRPQTEALDLHELGPTLAVAAQIEVVRDPDFVAQLARYLGITLNTRHELRSGGGYLANVVPAPANLGASLLGWLPLVARTHLVVDEAGRPELFARGGWRLSLPLMGERIAVTDAEGVAHGHVVRAFGLLRYRLETPEGTLELKRDGLSLRYVSADDPNTALEVYRPSWFLRWFFGPFAGERGVRVHLGSDLSESARRLLLVAGVHLDRSL